jgi:hypothetical protein
MTDETRQERATAAKAGKGASPRGGAGASRPGRLTVRSRPDRYLVAAMPPADVRAVTTQLEDNQSGRVVRFLSGPGSHSGSPDIAAVEMAPEHAAVLATCPGIHAEPDYAAGGGRHPGVRPPAVVTRRVVFEVLDDGMRPIEDATVTLADSGFPVTGFTGSDGRTEITVTPDALAGPRAVEIRPPRGCWPLRVSRPLLDQTGPVRVVCTRITSTYPEFPERALDSWGARVMGFGRLPPTYRGSGARVAVIDSGAAVGHPDLSGQLEHGRDLIGQDEKGWQENLIGTGTHHASLIAGRDDGTGIVGLAPEAEVHICRISPGGSVANPLFRLEPGKPRVTRDPARPARLLEIIKGSCRPLPQLDPAGTGAGIPDAAVALGVAPRGAYPPLSMPYPAPAPAADGRTPLGPLNAAMWAAGLITGDKPTARRTRDQVRAARSTRVGARS